MGTATQGQGRPGCMCIYMHVACRYMYMFLGQLHVRRDRAGQGSQEAYQLESVAALIVVRIESEGKPCELVLTRPGQERVYM